MLLKRKHGQSFQEYKDEVKRLYGNAKQIVHAYFVNPNEHFNQGRRAWKKARLERKMARRKAFHDAKVLVRASMREV